MPTFQGTAGADVYQGGPNDDTIYGLAGNDTLRGGEGNDVIAGDDGADRIEGGGGSDILYSGNQVPATNFAYYYFLNGVYPAVDTGAERDVLSGADGNDVLFAGYGDDIDGGGGSGEFYPPVDYLYISFMGASRGVTADFRLETQTIGGGTITGIESVNYVQGSNFDDDITIGSRSNSYSNAIVLGMGGNDRIIADYYTTFI